MKTGARRRTTSSDPPPPPLPVKNEIHDQIHLKNRNRKQQQQQQLMNDEENEDYYDDDDVNGGENDGDEQRPKLAEGFYEIEALRKTRIRKGVKQYLIKWRGWPESANTWEPVESFMSCPDVLEAFESMNSGKRKRKRKHTVDSTSQPKKKLKQEQVSPDPCVHNSNVTENNVGGTNYSETANHSNELEGKLSEIKTSSFMNQENMTEFAIHIKEDPTGPADGAANGISKVDKIEVPCASPRIRAANRISKVIGTEVRRSSPRFGAANVVSKVVGSEVHPASPPIGARRRKSCAVKRFKKESNSAPKKDPTEQTTIANQVLVQDEVRNADDVVNGLESDNILETPQSVPVITKIVKPVNYSISVINDTEDVSVSFLVKRSDEEEVVVDNKYLKENNPVLLIDFYEQHLRYNSSSE